MTLKILCLSNGHGEDAIALQILKQLQKYPLPPELAALPLVGEGQAYTELNNVTIIGPLQRMPSGGFIYMEGQQLWRDIKGGLFKLTFAQIKALRHWVSFQTNNGHQVAILAIGDIVPLLFAWLSGAPYTFFGTAKSEYHLRDEVRELPPRSWVERFLLWSGSVYFPWERWLMGLRKCRAVIARDKLTAQMLRKKFIRAYYVGNPMMDALELESSQISMYKTDRELPQMQRQLIITLLPGSRSPEAYANWEIIGQAIAELIETFAEERLLFLGAIAPNLTLEPLSEILKNYGWRADREIRNQTQSSILQLPVDNPQPALFSGEGSIQFPLQLTYKNATLILNQQAFQDFLHQGDFAIAMAGTATEQFVGLGKPAIAIPGNGPQFTTAFAEAQSRLLGPSLILVKDSQQVGAVVKSLLNDRDRLQSIAENGVYRMGEPGASQKIANFLMELSWA
ncbi:MAG: lipid-A-disaccharide synthase-related protein [Microcoleaceae cyanobacterium MO_207.B10]|nr:lipid-A-disaccharide synthase-related protein [Microcoleaceae cyanobacterium MO_207.B10]